MSDPKEHGQDVATVCEESAETMQVKKYTVKKETKTGFSTFMRQLMGNREPVVTRVNCGENQQTELRRGGQ